MFKKIRDLSDKEMNKLHVQNRDKCRECPLAIIIAGEIMCGRELKSQDTLYAKSVLEKINENVVNI